MNRNFKTKLILITQTDSEQVISMLKQQLWYNAALQIESFRVFYKYNFRNCPLLSILKLSFPPPSMKGTSITIV